jgi:hypothetical protein
MSQQLVSAVIAQQAGTRGSYMFPVHHLAANIPVFVDPKDISRIKALTIIDPRDREAVFVEIEGFVNTEARRPAAATAATVGGGKVGVKHITQRHEGQHLGQPTQLRNVLHGPVGRHVFPLCLEVAAPLRVALA